MYPHPGNRILVLRILLASVFCIVGTTIVVAQEVKKPLSNADVVEMTKAGLPENTIILTIQKGPSRFDTSPQELIQLKKQGVSSAVLDAMIRADSHSSNSTPITAPVHKTNPLDPLSPATMNGQVTAGVTLVDGDARVSMKYSVPETRTSGMLGAVVNPFHKTKGRSALNGNHAQLRTKNTSPLFEVGILVNANPTDVIALVKLKPKSDRREIETLRVSIMGASSGFRKEDLVAISMEEILSSSIQGQRLYRVKSVNPLPPGEYALVYSSGVFYDFGVDAN